MLSSADLKAGCGEGFCFNVYDRGKKEKELFHDNSFIVLSQNDFMSTEEAKEIKPLTGYAEITDPELIEKYNKLELFIATNEGLDTMDTEHLSMLKESRNRVGTLRPIEVAINEDDPYRDTQRNDRIHLRIINGRHRYMDDPKSPRKYYSIPSFDNYNLARLHFDLQKKKSAKEMKVVFNNWAEKKMKEDMIPPAEVCGKLIEELHLNGIQLSETTVRELLDPIYKDPAKSKAKSGKTFEKSGKKTKIDKIVDEKAGQKLDAKEAELLKYKNEVDALQIENDGLRKDNTAKTAALEEVESKLRIVSALTTTYGEGENKITISVDAVENKIIVVKA